MIYLLAGEIGSGKTLYSMEVMDQAARRGRDIMTNIDLLPGCWFAERAIRIGGQDAPIYDEEDNIGFWNTWSVLREHLKAPLIVIDEADIEFDCKNHSKLGSELFRWLKQSRKLNVDIVFICQNLNNLHNRIRRLAQVTWVCEWSWVSAPGYQTILAPVIGTEAAKALTHYRRWQFSDAGCRQLVGIDALSYTSVARKYFRDPWYDTDQLLGDWSHEDETARRRLKGFGE